MKQIKQTNVVTHDFITAFVIKVLNFAKKNKSAIFIILALVLLAGAGTMLYCNHKENVYQESWKAYFMATTAEGEGAQAAALELESKFPTETPTYLYVYYQAEELYKEGQYAQAAQVYENLLSAKNKEIAALAGVSLATSYYAAGQYDKALSAAQNFLKEGEDHYAAAQAYQVLAMAQEKLGKNEEAKATYTLITERFSGGYFDAFAKNKIKTLK